MAIFQPHGESLSAALEAEAEESVRQEMVGGAPGKFDFLDPVTHETTSTLPFSETGFVTQ